MTTLPATIPGLVRRGSPVIDHAGDKMIACELVPGIGARCLDGGKLHGYTFRSLSLDLTDPTGFHHALLWLAEKLGMDASAGVLWYWDAEWGTWYLQAKQRGRRYVIVDGRAVPCGAMEIPPASQEVSPTEALRLAVLTVAGVEG